MRRWIIRTCTLAAPLVLLAQPASAAGIMETLKGDPQFSRLVALVDEAGIAGDLENAGAATLLAPTNAAFVMIPDSAIERLKEKDQLAAVLRHHLVQGEAIESADLGGKTLKTADGGSIEAETGKEGRLYLLQPGAELSRLGDNLLVRTEAPARPAAGGGAAPGIKVALGPDGKLTISKADAAPKADAKPAGQGDAKQADAQAGTKPDAAANAKPEGDAKPLGASASPATPDPLVRAQNKPEKRTGEDGTAPTGEAQQAGSEAKPESGDAKQASGEPPPPAGDTQQAADKAKPEGNAQQATGESPAPAGDTQKASGEGQEKAGNETALAATESNTTPDPLVGAKSNPEAQATNEKAAGASTAAPVAKADAAEAKDDPKTAIAQVARVVAPDIAAGGAVVQGIDRLLLPESAIKLFTPDAVASAQ